MVFDCILNDCQIVNVQDKKAANKDTGEEINWCQVVFVQGTNVNTMTIKKEVAPKLVLGSKVDLLVSVSEQFQKGGGKVQKFKVIDFQDVPFDN